MQQAEELKELIYKMAVSPEESGPTRLNAAQAFLNRIEGLPVARQITASLDDLKALSDEQLEQELRRLESGQESLLAVHK